MFVDVTFDDGARKQECGCLFLPTSHSTVFVIRKDAKTNK